MHGKEMIATGTVWLVILWVKRREETSFLVRGVAGEIVRASTVHAITCGDVFPWEKKGGWILKGSERESRRMR